MLKSSYKLITIIGKSVFETLELTFNFAEPLSYSALKIRFYKAYYKGYLLSLKIVPKSYYKLIAIISKSILKHPPLLQLYLLLLLVSEKALVAYP